MLQCPMPLPKETKPWASLQQLTLEIPGYSKANAYKNGFVQEIQINQYGVNEPLKHTHFVPASGASLRMSCVCVFNKPDTKRPSEVCFLSDYYLKASLTKALSGGTLSSCSMPLEEREHS